MYVDDAPAVYGWGPWGRRMICNYRSRYFGVCDMDVETVEPDPMQESIIYLAKRKLRLSSRVS